ncbi:MAG: glycosyltransferase WbuB, partial [Thermoanaerobaculia bacterium]
MRVTLLNQYYAPDEAATAQVLSDLGEGLVAAGHDVTAICGDRSYADPSRRYPRRETLRGVHILRAGTTAFGRTSKAGRAVDYVSFYFGALARLVLTRMLDGISAA